jgi:hypothetical protein
MKGYWPLGRRRNNPSIPPAQLARLLVRLKRSLDHKGISLRAASQELAVHDRTLRRWIAGIDLPAMAKKLKF